MIKTSEQSWPAWQVKRRPLASLLPYARNARTHSPAQVKQIAASIAEWGWTMPVLVDDDGVLIAGHGRVLAAQGLGIADVPTMTASGWTEAQVKAYRIADNKLTLNAGWDEGLLTLELGELRGLDFDLPLIGFDSNELLDILGNDVGQTDPDAAVAPPEAPATREGDVWRLGSHRLMCGSSLSADAVSALMQGRRASLVATDPPYLVDYSGGQHPGRANEEKDWGERSADVDAASRASRKRDTKNKDWSASYREGTAVNTEQAVAFFADFIRTACEHAAAEHAAWYIWHASARQRELEEAMERCGLFAHQQIIWAKSRPVLTYSHFMWGHEPCFYGWRRGKQPLQRPPPSEGTVWRIDSKIEDGANGIHPTQKPVETVERPISYHTKVGDLLFEPFSGSGTALIAAEKTQRVCYAMELSPPFVDAAVLRWQAFTGQEAVLDSTGQTFAATATVRAQAAA
jgi:DNA modification methylase